MRMPQTNSQIHYRSPPPPSFMGLPKCAWMCMAAAGPRGLCCGTTHQMVRTLKTSGSKMPGRLCLYPYAGGTVRHRQHAVGDATARPGATEGSTQEIKLHSPYLTGLSFTRPFTVLDLAADSAGAWVTRVGGTFAISTAAHTVTQHWARNIVEAFPHLRGLRYNSRFAGAPCLAFYLPALTAMPGRPNYRCLSITLTLLPE